MHILFVHLHVEPPATVVGYSRRRRNAHHNHRLIALSPFDAATDCVAVNQLCSRNLSEAELQNKHLQQELDRVGARCCYTTT